MTTTVKPPRRILSPAALHAMTMAQTAAEQAAAKSGTTTVLSRTVDMKGLTVKAKGEAKTGARVSSQRVGRDVIAAGAPREKGPIPNGLLLPGTYSAEQFVLLMLHGGKRQVHEMVGEVSTPVTYPNGSPKMMVDGLAKILDEQVAISGFLGYYQPHMEGSREAGPHGVQLAKAQAKAYALINSGRGDAKMSNGAFPMAPGADQIKRWHRGASATLAGWSSALKGLPAPEQKILNDLLKREELCAQSIAHHEFASERILDAIGKEQDDALAQAMEKDHDFHQGRSALERERVIEIRRQLASRGIHIPATLLEKDIEAEGDEVLQTPSAHSSEPHDEERCEDEKCNICFEDVDGEDEVIENVPPPAEDVDACAPTERDPLASVQANAAPSYTVDDDGCIIEPPAREPSIAEQIAALKAANAALRAEAPATAPKGKAAVEVKPIIDVTADTTDEDLRVLLGSL